MKVYRSLEEVPAGFGPSSLTIGNFDGVHAAHRRILTRVRDVAVSRGLKSSVLTFDPHPTRIVAPARTPALMTSPAGRCALMAAAGIDQVLILPFTEAIAALTPEEFVERILVNKLDARAVLVGDNFRFGHAQAGNTRVLNDLGARFGFTTEVVSAVRMRGQMVSSSAIRLAIQSGNVSRACRMLERPYALEGEVVSGRGVGSRQTVPTLNLATTAEVLPARGVYITRTHSLEDGGAWPSITNIGNRPTFDGGEISIETFLLEPLAGETPRHIRVEFLQRVRDERKFPDPNALKTQILRDVSRARAYFRRLNRFAGARAV